MTQEDKVELHRLLAVIRDLFGKQKRKSPEQEVLCKAMLALWIIYDEGRQQRMITGYNGLAMDGYALRELFEKEG
jgi:hypothetical protein